VLPSFKSVISKKVYSISFAESIERIENNAAAIGKNGK
jgi:hypothetical protein